MTQQGKCQNTRNPFAFFVHDQRAKYYASDSPHALKKYKDGEMGFMDVMQEIGRTWKNLPEAQKIPYKTLHAQDKMRNRREEELHRERKKEKAIKFLE